MPGKMSKSDEKKWKLSKKAATKAMQKHPGKIKNKWAYTMGTFKKMKGEDTELLHRYSPLFEEYDLTYSDEECAPSHEPEDGMDFGPWCKPETTNLKENEETYHKLKKQGSILKDPSLKDLMELVKKIPEEDMKIVKAVIARDDVFAWTDLNLEHHIVIEQENLPKSSITLEIDFSESPIEIRLSVTNKKLNNIYELPKEKQAVMVMEHPQVEKLFGKYDKEKNLTDKSGMYKATFK